MKWIVIPLLVVFILSCGCASNPDHPIEASNQYDKPTETTVVPTPVTVTPTYLPIPTSLPAETPGPTPTPNYNDCFNKNITTPDFCYDHFYWVRPTVTPSGMGYTARVWQNSECVDMNRTSGVCEGWGDDTWTALFLNNLTTVRNLTSVNMTEVIAAVTYYNKTWDLNIANGMSFDAFIKKYWDGTYPAVKYDYALFAPDPNAVIVPINTFNPNAF